MTTTEDPCRRCDGAGTEDVELSATILGRELNVTGVLSKTCERCDGDGTHVRPKRFDELSDLQIKVLTEADIYRETGGKTEDDIPDTPSTTSTRTPRTPNI